MSLRNEVIDKMSALITAAFGLAAALARDGAIQAIFNEVFSSAEKVAPMILYAVLITVIAVIMTIWIARAAAKVKPKEAPK